MFCSKGNLPAEVVVSRSFDEAVTYARNENTVEKVYVIGGAAVYKAALESADCEQILLTRVFTEFPCDTFLPPFSQDSFELDASLSSQVYDEDGIRFQFLTFKKKH